MVGEQCWQNVVMSDDTCPSGYQDDDMKSTQKK